jgi:fido (protein-threonine AMPylation protein)
MAFEPDYGETLLTEDECEALTPDARKLLGNALRKSDLYDLEQQIQDAVGELVVEQVLEGVVSPSDLLTDHFVRDLHRRLYGPVWQWGGRQRSRETNIGIAPDRISAVLRGTLDDFRYQWEHHTGWTPPALGIAAHAAVVHIHPFVDGNGRVSRLLADLLFLAAQDDEPVAVYDWNINRATYIHLLEQYDVTRDPTPLVEFIPVVELADE